MEPPITDASGNLVSSLLVRINASATKLRPFYNIIMMQGLTYYWKLSRLGGYYFNANPPDIMDPDSFIPFLQQEAKVTFLYSIDKNDTI